MSDDNMDVVNAEAVSVSVVLSLLLFVAVSVPAALRAKLRTLFPVKYAEKRTVVALTYSPFCEKVFWCYERCKLT